MEIKKHLLINMNLAFTLSDVRLLAALALFLFVPSFPAQAFPTQETTTPKTFADWCLNQHNLSMETLRTIHAMLTVAQTKDCAQANELLSNRTELYLAYNSIAELKPLSTLTQLTFLDLSGNSIADLKPLATLTNLTRLSLAYNSIADLKPLSTLTQLTSLDLFGNSIADLKPLSTLIQLTSLDLSGNSIADLKPLSTLTKLTFLDLSGNSIADLKPLLTLTNLTQLSLNDNQMLTDKSCPVQPESICRF
jgi:internalin A